MSSFGQGSLSFSPKQAAGGSVVPPFPINSADNGLSVDAITGRIVLGNNVGGGLADLLSDREIEMAGFLLQLISGGNRQLYIEPTTGEYFIGDVDSSVNGSFLTVNDAFNFFSFTSRGNEYLRIYAQLFGQSYIMGDVGGADNGSQINIDDQTETIILATNTGAGLRVNNNSQSYQFGATSFGNGTQLSIDDSTQLAQILFGLDALLSIDQPNDTFVFGDLNTSATYFFNDAFGFEISSGGVPSVGMNVMDFTFGDYNATQNKTYLDVDDTNQIIRMFFNNDPYLVLDHATGNYAIGDYNNFVLPVVGIFTGGIDGIYIESNNTPDASRVGIYVDNGIGAQYPQIEDIVVGKTGAVGSTKTHLSFEEFYFDSGLTADKRFWLDVANNRYSIGDIDAALNGTFLEIDDANNVFNFSNTANTAVINMNGVAGFTGTVTPVTSITVNGGIVTNVT